MENTSIGITYIDNYLTWEYIINKIDMKKFLINIVSVYKNSNSILIPRLMEDSLIYIKKYGHIMGEVQKESPHKSGAYMLMKTLNELNHKMLFVHEKDVNKDEDFKLFILDFSHPHYIDHGLLYILKPLLENYGADTKILTRIEIINKLR